MERGILRNFFVIKRESNNSAISPVIKIIITMVRFKPKNENNINAVPLIMLEQMDI